MKSNKILLQLSGGKDSVACLINLIEQSFDVEAIHFVHEYSYDIPTSMSKMVCEKYNVQLHIININKEIESLFLNDFKNRPCRYCKSIMDRITIDFAKEHHFGSICVGDTADDTMLVNRIRKVDGGVYKESRYFNAHVDLPDDMIIYRPLIDKDSSYTLNLVYSKFPGFVRLNDTGDKYFEYSREGCPLQFKDLGASYTKELMEKLKTLNTLCSQFATAKGIKASIHLPSEYIVTIPTGYEDECREYIESNGYTFRAENGVHNIVYSVFITIILRNIENHDELLQLAVPRMCERMNMNMEYKENDGISLRMLSNNTSVYAVSDKRMNIINIVVNSTDIKIHSHAYEHICIEIFHTNKFIISKTVTK